MKRWKVVLLSLGVVAVGGGVYYLMKRRDRDLVDDFLNVGRRAGYEYEKLPLTLVVDAVKSENTWLPALFIGVANWGVQWPSGMVPPPDPEGIDWSGTRARDGKHQQDGTARFPYGGLGIAHADSSFLQDILEVHNPRLLQLVGDRRFDRGGSSDDILGIPELREAFFEWSTPWLAQPQNERLIAEMWRDRTWAPSVFETGDVRTAIANSRIRNSASGYGRAWAQLPIEEQLQRYADYRGESQVRNIQRVLLLYDLVQSGQLDNVQMRGIFPLP